MPSETKERDCPGEGPSSPLVALFSELLNRAFSEPPTSQDSSDAFWESVKLVHADDLRRWTQFQEYRKHNSLTYREYREGARRLAALRREIHKIPATLERIKALDNEELLYYDSISISIPRSLLRGTVTMELPPPPLPGTAFRSRDGEVRDGRLTVKAGWRRRQALVSLYAPARIVHAEEIAEMRRWLEKRSDDEWKKFRELKSSRFAQPVLFVSHRWESQEHPDPYGTQREKLATLENCFIIYDYSSFPQNPQSEEEQAALRLILDNMDQLIRKVVILASPAYTERGWCLYEYLTSSFTGSVICDEVRDPDFVALRNWCSMRDQLPFPGSPRGHSIESTVQNSTNEAILEAVNRILPKYGGSQFTISSDRDVVTNLLIQRLKESLPPKKEYLPYVGEWQRTGWKREELERAFTELLQWEPLETSLIPILPEELEVPATIEEAVEKNYVITRPPRHIFSATFTMFKSFMAAILRRRSANLGPAPGEPPKAAIPEEREESSGASQ